MLFNTQSGTAIERFRDRHDAGRRLADKLVEKGYATEPNLLVLALPRGGLPVAYEVAKRLNAPLDVFLVRKLGVPGHEELAMGAIATGGGILPNEAGRPPLDSPRGEMRRGARDEGGGT